MKRTKNIETRTEDFENGNKIQNISLENFGEKTAVKEFPKTTIELVPPDGGWGWMIVVGGFITIVLGSFPLFSFSILFSPLLMSSGVSSTKIAWIFNIHGFIWSVYTLFIGPLCEEYGWRKISIIGGVTNFLSIFLSVFVVDVNLLFLTFSVLGGIGGSTGFSVCFLAVSKYFLNHRGCALAITTLGSTASSFLGPLVANYLLENFGYMGAALIYSAIVLNQCVGGALFQPVEWHMKSAKNNLLTDNNVHEELLKENHASENENNCDVIQIKNEEKRTQKLRNNQSASLGSIERVGQYTKDILLPRSERDHYLKVVQNKSILHQFKKIMQLTYKNLKALKFVRVMLIATAHGCLFLGYVNFQMWIPFIVTNAGYTLEVAAWCVSIGSITNGIGKICISLLSDRKWFNVRYGFMFGLLLIGMTIVAFTFARKLEIFFTIACFWGFGVGVALSLHTTVMIRIMGVELFPAVLGVASLLKGIINLVFGPLVGFARDASSSYMYAMFLLGGVVLFGFFLYLFMPLAVKYDQNKINKRSANYVE